MNQKIYVVLTQTYTVLARIITFITKQEYSHASISLDDTCTNMYSFARKHPRNPFIGVFKVENIKEGIFKIKKNSKIAIYEIMVTKKQKEIIEKTIKNIEKNNKGYNIIGLFLASINKKVNRKKYYCSEFVYYVLNEAKLVNKKNIAAKPKDLITKESKLIYNGKISDYILK